MLLPPGCFLRLVERMGICGCSGPVHFVEDANGETTVTCTWCNTTWWLKEYLKETVSRIQAVETTRLGRPLTPSELRNIDDQCYFLTTPRGALGPAGKGSFN